MNKLIRYITLASFCLALCNSYAVVGAGAAGGAGTQRRIESEQRGRALGQIEQVEAAGEFAEDLSPAAVDDTGAQATGFYISGQGGVGWTDDGGAFLRNIHEVPFNHSRTEELTLAFILGYQFTDHVSGEVVYYHLPSEIYNGIFWNADRSVIFSTRQIKMHRHQALALFAKYQTPAFQRFKIFGKAGVAYVHMEGKFISAFTFSPQYNLNYKKPRNAMRPIVAVGVSYPFSDEISADLTYTYIFSWGKSTICGTFDNSIAAKDCLQPAIPSTQAITLGITAHLFATPTTEAGTTSGAASS